MARSSASPLPSTPNDREIIAWVATSGGGISDEMIRDMMLDCVERRFDAIRAPQPVQWLADNGSAYTAAETTDFAAALNLVPCFTPVRSPESNGVCEAFVKTLKRDYARVNPIRHARPGSRNGSPWLLALLGRKPRKLAAIALANKMARIVWAMMERGTAYRPPAAMA